MKKIVIVLVMIVAAALVFGRAGSDDPITWGFVGPLTGDAAVFGLVEQRVIEIAKDEINESGGILGRELRVIYEDGKCEPAPAVNAAQKLIQIDKVDIILSDCSSETLAIAPIAESNSVVVISAWAMQPDITNAGDFIFRTGYSDFDTAKVSAEVIYEKSASLGVITELTSYPTGLRDALDREFVALGGEVAHQGVQLGAKDVRTELRKLISEDVGAILLNPNTPATGMVMLRQLHELGYDGLLFGNFFGSSKDAVESPFSEGMIFVTDPDESGNDVQKELFAEYERRYGELPAFSFPAASRYDSVYILKEAIEAVGEDTEDIRDYLYELESYSGALGTYRFDENGDVVGIVPVAKQIVGGEIVSYK